MGCEAGPGRYSHKWLTGLLLIGFTFVRYDRYFFKYCFTNLAFCSRFIIVQWLYCFYCVLLWKAPCAPFGWCKTLYKYNMIDWLNEWCGVPEGGSSCRDGSVAPGPVLGSEGWRQELGIRGAEAVGGSVAVQKGAELAGGPGCGRRRTLTCRNTGPEPTGGTVALGLEAQWVWLASEGLHVSFGAAAKQRKALTDKQDDEQHLSSRWAPLGAHRAVLSCRSDVDTLYLVVFFF